MVGLAALLTRSVDPAGRYNIDPDVVQDTLDRHATTVQGARLTGTPHPITRTTLTYAGPHGWADDAVVTNAAGDPLAPTADPLRGRWTFDTDTPGPVHIDGTYYELNAAAAELAELLAAQVAGGILSFTDAAGESWSRGDAAAALLELANRFRARVIAEAGAAGVGSVSINASEQRNYGMHPGAGWLAP
jgi:hypothetical protein